jgi:N-acetyl-gamma-glutamyl-phosphate reductase
LGNLFCEVNESVKAYAVGKHRHIGEIEQELSKASGSKMIIEFTPHLLPINRGIISTIYCTIKDGFKFPVNVKGFINTDLGKIDINYTQTSY